MEANYYGDGRDGVDETVALDGDRMSTTSTLDAGRGSVATTVIVPDPYSLSLYSPPGNTRAKINIGSREQEDSDGIDIFARKPDQDREEIPSSHRQQAGAPFSPVKSRNANGKKMISKQREGEAASGTTRSVASKNGGGRGSIFSNADHETFQATQIVEDEDEHARTTRNASNYTPELQAFYGAATRTPPVQPVQTLKGDSTTGTRSRIGKGPLVQETPRRGGGAAFDEDDLVLIGEENDTTGGENFHDHVVPYPVEYDEDDGFYPFTPEQLATLEQHHNAQTRHDASWSPSPHLDKVALGPSSRLVRQQPEGEASGEVMALAASGKGMGKYGAMSSVGSMLSSSGMGSGKSSGMMGMFGKPMMKGGPPKGFSTKGGGKKGTGGKMTKGPPPPPGGRYAQGYDDYDIYGYADEACCCGCSSCYWILCAVITFAIVAGSCVFWWFIIRGPVICEPKGSTGAGIGGHKGFGSSSSSASSSFMQETQSSYNYPGDHGAAGERTATAEQLREIEDIIDAYGFNVDEVDSMMSDWMRAAGMEVADHEDLDEVAPHSHWNGEAAILSQENGHSAEQGGIIAQAETSSRANHRGHDLLSETGQGNVLLQEREHLLPRRSDTDITKTEGGQRTAQEHEQDRDHLVDQPPREDNLVPPASRILNTPTVVRAGATKDAGVSGAGQQGQLALDTTGTDQQGTQQADGKKRLARATSSTGTRAEDAPAGGFDQDGALLETETATAEHENLQNKMNTTEQQSVAARTHERQRLDKKTQYKLAHTVNKKVLPVLGLGLAGKLALGAAGIAAAGAAVPLLGGKDFAGNMLNSFGAALGFHTGSQKATDENHCKRLCTDHPSCIYANYFSGGSGAGMMGGLLGAIGGTPNCFLYKTCIVQPCHTVDPKVIKDLGMNGAKFMGMGGGGEGAQAKSCGMCPPTDPTSLTMYQEQKALCKQAKLIWVGMESKKGGQSMGGPTVDASSMGGIVPR
ncbi:unnamed protein product [Amoebophrya sp. A120]|nr:unnamed protein product [Amoebophrya sp. A120]|eukprot:GSA120T00001965001.1